MFTSWRRQLRRGVRQNSLAWAGLEGVVVAGMFAFTEIWLVHLLVTGLGASDFQVGLLATLPMAAMALIGPFTGVIIDFMGGNRSALVWCCSLQSFALTLLLPCLWATDQSWAVPLAIFAATLIGGVGAFGGPAWMALLGTLIPRPIRGRWIGGRLRWFLGTKLLIAGLFSLVMETWPVQQGPWGMVALIIVACGSRVWSSTLNARLKEMPQRTANRQEAAGCSISYWSVLKEDIRTLIHGPMGPWTLSYCIFLIGVHASAPYFAPYLLRGTDEGGLAMSSLGYVMILQISQIVRLLALPIIGIMVDRLGPLSTLRACLIVICGIPVVWGISPHLSVIALAEVASGMAWCTAECSIAVLLFNCHENPATRGRLVALHQSLCCVIVMVSSLLGAWLLELMPAVTGSIYRDLFILSGLIRFPGAILAFILLPSMQLAHPAGRIRFRQALAEVPSPMILTRGLGRFLRRPEG